jgi:hypothetical protein
MESGFDNLVTHGNRPGNQFMMIDLIRVIHAATKFKISDDFDFVEFEDLSLEEAEKEKQFPDLLEIMARTRLHYEGEPPESYKALNLMIGDWVEKNLGKLTDVIHEKLKEHFNTFYPESEHSALDDVDNTAIWADQLDYMPDIDEEARTIVIDVELVLHAEPQGDEQC